MIIRDKKAIFFHIPRTAGSSIECSLLGGQEEWQKIRRQTQSKCSIKYAFGYDSKNKWAAQHVTPREIISYISLDDYEKYFTFAFVRNPWDRLVSVYIHNKFGNKVPFKEFPAYVKEQIEKDFYRPGVSTDTRNVHLIPQTDYTHPQNKSPIDFVGRFENLKSDFRKVCDKLGMKYNLPHVNKSNHKDYRSFYTPDLVEAVAEIYKKEIVLFNYKF